MSEQMVVEFLGCLYDTPLSELEVDNIYDTFSNKTLVYVNEERNAVFACIEIDIDFLFFGDFVSTANKLESVTTEEEFEALDSVNGNPIAFSSGVASWYNGVDSPFYNVRSEWEGWRYE